MDLDDAVLACNLGKYGRLDEIRGSLLPPALAKRAGRSQVAILSAMKDQF